MYRMTRCTVLIATLLGHHVFRTPLKPYPYLTLLHTDLIGLVWNEYMLGGASTRDVRCLNCHLYAVSMLTLGEPTHPTTSIRTFRAIWTDMRV